MPGVVVFNQVTLDGYFAAVDGVKAMRGLVTRGGLCRTCPLHSGARSGTIEP